ncbi:MAG: lytic transglycosylase domain-containing protein [Fimbriimonadales bacterium]|nr:lytic transglycosylase domain-containing protein [Fimbriimonadales bacterium]
MRISDAFQKTLQRVQEIEARVRELRGEAAQPMPNRFDTAFIAPVGFPAGETPPPGMQIRPRVQAWEPVVAPIAARYHLDTALVLRVIEAESGGDPRAVSPKGAIGLMQLMPETARALGVSDPFDPVQNIEGGVRYLSHLLQRFGDLRLALAAYNAGPGNVQRYGGVPPFPETQRYLERVLG